MRERMIVLRTHFQPDCKEILWYRINHYPLCVSEMPLRIFFCSGGKPSAKKRKYMGRAIEEILCSVDEETRDAVQLLSQWYQILGDINVPDEFRSSHVNDLCSLFFLFLFRPQTSANAFRRCLVFL